jgi:hypothetical protein
MDQGMSKRIRARLTKTQRSIEIRLLAKALGYEMFGIKKPDEAEDRFTLALAKKD